MRIFALSLPLILNILPAMALSQEIGIVAPNAPSGHITVFSQPGFDTKSCNIHDVCASEAWPKAGDSLEILRRVEVKDALGGETRYYEVRYRNRLNETKRGFVAASLVTKAQWAAKPCDNVPFSELVRSSKDVVGALASSTLPGGESIPIMNDRQKTSPKCSQFIDASGQIGEWGRGLLEAIDLVDQDFKQENGGKSCFYDVMTAPKVCPKFKKFPPQKKMAFWTYTFASIAQIEASCNPSAQAKGTYGIADGLFQLEYDTRLRRRSERDPDFCSTRRPVDTQGLTFQFQCAASIFKDFYCKASPPRSLSDTQGYWEELRYKPKNRKRIISMIKQFPGCFK